MTTLLEEIVELKFNCVKRQDYVRATSFRTLERKLTKTVVGNEWLVLKSNYSKNTSQNPLDLYICYLVDKLDIKKERKAKLEKIYGNRKI